ncbi:MAG: hypothetical protein ACRCWS_08255 [Propionibacteriaceae bacterium]
MTAIIHSATSFKRYPHIEFFSADFGPHRRMVLVTSTEVHLGI